MAFAACDVNAMLGTAGLCCHYVLLRSTRPKWGRWDLNPRSTDYESAAQTRLCFHPVLIYGLMISVTCW